MLKDVYYGDGTGILIAFRICTVFKSESIIKVRSLVDFGLTGLCTLIVDSALKSVQFLNA